MTKDATEWFTLTPAGALRAFGQSKPDDIALRLQVLLTGEHTLDATAWSSKSGADKSELWSLEAPGWVQRLQRPLQGPDAKLDIGW